ncbi:MAG: GreA/GreB family elongation factor [Victivallales bacterium]|nr:GreA/GreB family elongation factor [Victivallales bacterium]
MSASNLEELFIDATESFTAETPAQLLTELQQLESLQDNPTAESIDFLVESWDGHLNPARAEFIVALAALDPRDSATFRKVLAEAMKKLVPPYMNKTAFFRALGLRDGKVSLPETVIRFHTLQQLKIGVFTWQPDIKVWGSITSIDEFAGSVAVNALNGSNSFAVPLEKVLATFKLFSPSAETRKLAPASSQLRIIAKEFRHIAQKYVLNTLCDDELKQIAFDTIVPGFMSAAKFEGWWKSEAGSVVAGMGRKPSEARSIQELHMLMQKLEDIKGVQFDADDRTRFKAFFTRVRPVNLKDTLLLVESISMLATHLKPEELADILSPLQHRMPFWPEQLNNINLSHLEIWGKLQVKNMPGFIKASQALLGEQYLAEYALRLPLRCLTQFSDQIDHELLSDIILEDENHSSDILLWIWKNRGGLSDALLRLVNIRNVSIALAQRDLPAAWATAQRDLKKHLIDKKDFQSHLLRCAGDDVTSFVDALQGAKFFLPGEQQSLLVKLSRLSEPLRALIESGEGKKLLNGNHKAGDEGAQTSPAQSPTITSVRSHKALIQELEDIIRIHIPENREALKTARAHGDFRENAEYDAAKERRNFLSRRRNELERQIVMIQPINFKEIEVTDRIVIGSTAVVTYDNGRTETFHLVGAWDGNPEKNWLSYKTRLGELFLGKKIGDAIPMPDGDTGRITAVRPLPETMVKILADEA